MKARKFDQQFDEGVDLTASLDLSKTKRAQRAQELVEAVERDSDPEVAAAWDREIVSRIAAYERGEVTLIPAKEVFAEARRLTRRR